MPTSEESLERVGLQCPGELREELWSSFGWGSPWAMQCGGEDKPDEGVLEMLGLLSHQFRVAHPGLPYDYLQQLRAVTGAFLEQEKAEDGDAKLRVIGAPEELERVRSALAKEGWPEVAFLVA